MVRMLPSPKSFSNFKLLNSISNFDQIIAAHQYNQHHQYVSIVFEWAFIVKRLCCSIVDGHCRRFENFSVTFDTIPIGMIV